MSFTYKRKSNGNNIEPWGTPQDSLPGDEDSLPTFTTKDLSVRYDMYHAIVFPAKPRHLIFSRRMLWSIVSNAFWRSIKTIPVSNPSSKPILVLKKWTDIPSYEPPRGQWLSTSRVAHLVITNIGEIHYHKEYKTNGGRQIEFSAESN